MKCLVTGGAGFIGRWVVSELLRHEHEVMAFDDLSNGREENLKEFSRNPNYLGLVRGDIKSASELKAVFQQHRWDAVFHLGASIHVQRSIDEPEPTFANDADGTLRVLEACRRQYFEINGLDVDSRAFDYGTMVQRLVDRRPRVAVMSTCMVYDLANGGAISESHQVRPASPYAAAKIGADALALSYFHSYRLPVTVVRPFNTYGPHQKSNSEGGVVSIFLKRDIENKPLLIKGSGRQTRDLLYVEDCAQFVVRAAASEAAEGKVINAGTGNDIAIAELANICLSEGNTIEFVPHDHPQAEIMRLCCDARRAKELLNWTPTTGLEEGIRRTRTWLELNRWAW